MQAVIIAGGLGTRMAPLTNERPKALIPVLGEPFALRQLRWLASQGIEDVVYLTGHLGHMIQEAVGDNRYGMSIRYSQMPVGTEKYERLLGARSLLWPWFFTIYCDSYPCAIDLRQMSFEFLRNRPQTLMSTYGGVDYGVTAWDRTTLERVSYPIVEPWHEVGSFEGLAELERFLLVAQ